MSTNVRQDIESILKEIFENELKKIRKVYNWSFIDSIAYIFFDKLYYKVRGKGIEVIKSPELVLDFDHASSLNPEWLLYSNKSTTFFYNSKSFFSHSGLDSVLSIFMTDFNAWYSLQGGIKHIDDNDPLSQLLDYYEYITFIQRLPPRSYSCFEVILVVPHAPVYVPCFDDKVGIVAFCTTLLNFFNLLYRGDLEMLQAKAEKLFNSALKKLLNNKEFLELYFRGPPEYRYNIKLIEETVRDKIEEYNELMKQYGIFRIAFTTDGVSS